jgi:hypothetical protein
MGIQLKFREDAAADRRAEIQDEIAAAPGRPTVRPLFPGDEDPELASIFRVEGIPEDQEAALIDRLNGDADVEFAEPDVRRKLIR